jgi:hypothetical protein
VNDAENTPVEFALSLIFVGVVDVGDVTGSLATVLTNGSRFSVQPFSDDVFASMAEFAFVCDVP